MRIDTVSIQKPSWNVISDWISLGGVLNVKTNILSWVQNDKKSMQHKIKLGDRTVYKSDKPLRYVQNRLTALLEDVFNSLRDKDTAHILSYRKGFDVSTYLSEIPPADNLVSFDIRKFYDHITLGHIEETLTQQGFQRSGARLIARYCTVDRYGQQTLQQGSPASPVISNLVGLHYLDKIITQDLQTCWPDARYKYLRYCDNIAIFVYDQITAEQREEFKNRVKSDLQAVGFKTHKWDCISQKNPVKPQKFLGIIVNSQARVEKDKFDKFRALLFTWCVKGDWAVLDHFMTEHAINVPSGADTVLLQTKFEAWLRGHINYIKRINARQGLILEKLYKAAELCDMHRKEIWYRGFYQALPSDFFIELKTYRRADESLPDYLKKLEKFF